MKDMTDDERDLVAELGKLRRIHAQAASPLPPADLDENILARSREAVRVAARPRRWWIPASVAATALVALSLVTKIQHETATGLPETDVVTASRPATANADSSGEIAPAVAEPPPAPAAMAPRAQEAPAVPAQEATGKRTVPPRQAMPRMASGAATPQAGDGSAAAALAASRPDEDQAATVLNEPAAVVSPARKAERVASPLTPEAWLEKIEALEAEGRTDEAARQRVLLEQAYPGWLAGRVGPH